MLRGWGIPRDYINAHVKLELVTLTHSCLALDDQLS